MDEPVIFAANHQNALMDPLALVMTNPLQTLWLTRADIFKSRFTRPILKFMKMVPIYRIRDGKDNLANNEEIFNQVAHVLEQKDSIALFPEAAHSGKRQMLPHKKAIPRIALDAEEKNGFKLGLKIVPVGIYYDHYWNFDRTLLVQYGDAIEIDKYKNQFAENSQIAMLSLRDEIYDCLEPLTLQIHSTQYYHDYENIRLVIGKEAAENSSTGRNPVLESFRSDQRLIKNTEILASENSSVFEDLRSKIEIFTKKLKADGIDHSQLMLAKDISFIHLLGWIIASFISLPFMVAGMLFNIIPFYVTRKLLTRKIKDPAFLSTFTFVAGLVVYPVIYLIECCLLRVFTGSWLIALGSIIVMPLAGKLAYRLMISIRDLWIVIRLRTDKRRVFKILKSEYLNILEIYRAHLQ
jgi:1-acyl-sn-glycerol-3-phosphate acyltransferase